MSASPIRFGFVGLDHWYWAFSFADAVATSKDAEIVAVADSNLEHAQSFGKRFGVQKITTNPSELIEDPEIDVIASFISVDQNPKICIAAARSHKHIFSVKPMACSLAEATEILNAVREAGVVFFPSESANRLSPQAQQIKHWIAEGRLGRIISATYSQHAGLPQSWPDETESGWFIDPERAPGGGWIDHSIYHIDMLRWLLDTEVEKIGGRSEHLKYPDLAFEDYGLASIHFKNGLEATVEVTWIAPPRGGRTAWTMIGTEGAVSSDTMTGKLAVVGDFLPLEGWVQAPSLAGGDQGLSHMIACVRGEATPIATAEDGWRNLAACLAFYEAAAKGTTGTPETPPTK